MRQASAEVKHAEDNQIQRLQGHGAEAGDPLFNGGWVLNRFMRLFPVSGLTMNICAVDGFASTMGKRSEAIANFSRHGQTFRLMGQARSGFIGQILA